MSTIWELDGKWRDESDQYVLGRIKKKQGMSKQDIRQHCAIFWDHLFSPGEIPPKLREEMEYTINEFLHI